MLSQDNVGPSPSWFADRVLVTDEATGSKQAFLPRRWLGGRDSSSCVVVPLPPEAMADPLWSPNSNDLHPAGPVVFESSGSEGESSRQERRARRRRTRSLGPAGAEGSAPSSIDRPRRRSAVEAGVHYDNRINADSFDVEDSKDELQVESIEDIKAAQVAGRIDASTATQASVARLQVLQLLFSFRVVLLLLIYLHWLLLCRNW